ncbi:hypothetical protein BH18ACT15_BH18ACT15_13520 [soil metagenome]
MRSDSQDSLAGPASRGRDPRPVTSVSPDPSIAQAARNLMADATTSEVVSAFREAGIRSILLKGPVLDAWLYAADVRPYRDSDLLIAPRYVDEAENALGSLGFSHSPLDDLPGDRPWHAHAWLREADGANVDLHRTLIGVGVEPDALWDVLSSKTEDMVVEGTTVEVLTPPARAMHVALHAAQDGRRLGSPLEDLRRALDRLDVAAWRQAMGVAEELDAVPAFAAGLRMETSGARLAERLELPTCTTMEIALRSQAAPQLALSIEWLSRAPTAKAKAALLASKLFPPADYMRSWAPIARRGPLWLLSAYAWRIAWMALQAPGAFRAWRAARHDIERP